MKDYSIDSQTFLENLKELKLFIKKNKIKKSTTFKKLFQTYELDNKGRIVVLTKSDLIHAIGLSYFFKVRKDFDIKELYLDRYKYYSYNRSIIQLDLNFLNVSNIQDFSFLFSHEIKLFIPALLSKENADPEKFFNPLFNYIHPLFDSWEFTNARTMESMFAWSGYKGEKTPLIIKAPNLLSVKDMFCGADFNGSITIESDCLIDISNFITNAKESSSIKINLPLNNIVNFKNEVYPGKNFHNKKELIIHQNQKGFNEFIQHFIYFTSLMNVNFCINEVKNSFKKAFDAKFFKFTQEKKCLKLKILMAIIP